MSSARQQETGQQEVRQQQKMQPTARAALTPTVLAALAVVYLIWGSTYFGIKVAISTLPPLGMLALRFLVAGALLYAVLRVRGAAAPTPRQWSWKCGGICSSRGEENVQNLGGQHQPGRNGLTSTRESFLRPAGFSQGFP